MSGMLGVFNKYLPSDVCRNEKWKTAVQAAIPGSAERKNQEQNQKPKTGSNMGMVTRQELIQKLPRPRSRNPFLPTSLHYHPARSLTAMRAQPAPSYLLLQRSL